ncbi:hypothetical protein [Photobacterium kishitanii]|uniref:Uncharacterized protein n=1 Tax=Photobacterium kishitanii TaxID=318456 RepID=A0A2T3KN18_9GAMM|nr:hypothetical protein [Photobacterium kishitanii]PSV01196.1 hypothetical protein C9J27_04000 [Photobacterium kishitanii]
MEMITSLIETAAAGVGMPHSIKVSSGSISVSHLFNPRILIPLIVVVSNSTNYKSFGKELIKIKGGIIRDSSLPFGLRINDDLDLDRLEYPLGFLLLSLTHAMSTVKPILEKGMLDPLAAHCQSIFDDFDNGSEIPIERYFNKEVLSIQ